MDVVVCAVELAQFGAHAGAHVAHDLFASGEYRVVEHVSPVLGDEDQVCMEVEDNAATPTNIRVGCPPW